MWLRALLLAAFVAAAAPEPEPHPGPDKPLQAPPSALPTTPFATPGIIIRPGPGIYRPDWVDVDPKAPTPKPDFDGGLPRYVGLGPVERKLAEKLVDLLALAEGSLDANRLASARVALERADAHVAAGEREYLVLKLHGDWQRPRVQLLDLHARYKTMRARGGVDEESRALAAAAAQRITAQLDALAPARTPKEAGARLEAARRAVAAAAADPYLVDNPAWPAARLPVLKRLERIEHEVGLRVGQVQLAEAVARMTSLHLTANSRLAQGRYDDALGDLEALEEACRSFLHDLSELRAMGYDVQKLVWIGSAGELRGEAFLAHVAAWQAEGARRYDVVERARARARIREEQVLEPPTVPTPPALPQATRVPGPHKGRR